MPVNSVSPNCGCTHYTYKRDKNSSREALKAGAILGGLWGACKPALYSRVFITDSFGTVRKAVRSTRLGNIVNCALNGAAIMFLLDCVFGKKKNQRPVMLANAEVEKKPEIVFVNLNNNQILANDESIKIKSQKEKEEPTQEKIINVNEGEEVVIRRKPDLLEKDPDGFEDVQFAAL